MVKSTRFRNLVVAMVVSTALMAAAPKVVAQPLETQDSRIEYEIADGRVTFFFERLNPSDVRDIVWDGESIHSAVINGDIGQLAYHEDGFSIAFSKRLSLKGPGVLELVLADGRKLQKTLLMGPLPTLK